jgi:hypothetical protein
MVVLILRFVVYRPESEYCNEEKEEELQCSRNAIGDEVTDPLEDTPSYEDAVHNGR